MTDWPALVTALREGVDRGSVNPPAVIHVAIDHELDLLDLLGWDELQRVRAVVQQRLEAVLPERTIVAVGDFAWSAVAAPGPPTPEALHSLATLVQRAVSGLVTCDENEVFISTTVCASPVAGDEVEAALVAARLGCAEAQATGGNRAAVADRFDAAAGYDAGLTAALARAIEAREITAQYQPMIDLGTGRVVGVEALARWRQADGTFVSPEHFVAAAERSGLVGALDAALLDRVTDEYPRLREAMGRGFSLAVNVSPLRLVERRLLVDMRRLAELSESNGGALVAEITESALLAEPLGTRTVLHRLAASGVQIALDDFGTGVSSLSHLRDFPVDLVKIDRSFIADVGADPVTDGLVAAVVAAGSALGCTVVAEGVESEEQASALRGLGVDVGQGYLWVPATPADSLPAALAQLASAHPVASARRDRVAV